MKQVSNLYYKETHYTYNKNKKSYDKVPLSLKSHLEDKKDKLIEELRAEIADLKEQIELLRAMNEEC